MTKVDSAGDGDSAPMAASPPSLPKAPVEARSLSSITAIASNPPAYPRNPTQKKLDPLVLYIVRVPGSRDVFLTPLKPATKSSVSAEAINSSLYYLHVATPEDDVLLQEYEQEREEEARLRKEALGDEAEAPLPSREFARLNNVRRKPVPGASAPKVDATAPPPARPRPTSWQSQGASSPLNPDLQRPALPPRPSFQGPAHANEYNPVTPPFAPVNRDPVLESMPLEDPMAARPSRPLPAVPREEPVLGPPLDPLPAKRANRWSTALSGYLAKGQETWKEKYDAMSGGRASLDSRRPPVRPHSAHGSPSHSFLGSPSRSPARSPARSPGQSPRQRPHDRVVPERPGFHITLIRRDPTHGSQWNVATMSTPRMDGGPIDIDILTPGYNRFTAQNEPFSLASLGINLPGGQSISFSSSKHPLADLADLPPPTSVPNEPSQPRRFHRKLCVSRPYFQEEPRGSLDLPGRPSLDSTASGSPTKPHAPPHSKLKSGYYTFNSPWNGICTFTTSVNGRSLKCKHMIPTPGFPNASSHHHHPTSTPEPPAITVAEIRFNTPFRTGHLHQPVPSYASYHPTSPPTDSYLSSPQTPTSANPSSKRDSFARLLNPNKYTRPRARSGASITSIGENIGSSHHTRNPSNSSTSSGAGDLEEREKSGLLRRPPSEDRLDLSLARERAGGGLRGKSAKLGKLIIEDEGIKMLDLVVAACMAVYAVSC